MSALRRLRWVHLAIIVVGWSSIWHQAGAVSPPRTKPDLPHLVLEQSGVDDRTVDPQTLHPRVYGSLLFGRKPHYGGMLQPCRIFIPPEKQTASDSGPISWDIGQRISDIVIKGYGDNSQRVFARINWQKEQLKILRRRTDDYGITPTFLAQFVQPFDKFNPSYAGPWGFKSNECGGLLGCSVGRTLGGFRRFLHMFSVPARCSCLIYSGDSSPPRCPNSFLSVADSAASGAPHQSRENPQQARYEDEDTGSAENTFGVISQISRISCKIGSIFHKFPVIFGFISALLFFVVGIVTGYLFYNKRLVCGSATIGSGLLLLCSILWSI